MILFRYRKAFGAEYLSHLDVMRHLARTFRRAGIALRMSEGFHPHPQMHMGPPGGTGVKSLAEYCLAEPTADIGEEEFLRRYNAAAPAGLGADAAWRTANKVNVAAVISAAEYEIAGISFDPREVLDAERFNVSGRKGETDARDRIFSLERSEGGMRAVIAFGNRTLRPDEFGAALAEKFGGDPEFTRIAALDQSLRPVEFHIG